MGSVVFDVCRTSNIPTTYYINMAKFLYKGYTKTKKKIYVTLHLDVSVNPYTIMIIAFLLLLLPFKMSYKVSSMCVVKLAYRSVQQTLAFTCHSVGR